MLNWAKKNKVDLIVTTKTEEAVKNSDCVMTDKWVSMNDKVNKKAKKKKLSKSDQNWLDAQRSMLDHEGKYNPRFNEGEGRMGFSDLEKLGKENASKVDMECRRRGSADMEPGKADELRYKVAKEMGLVESEEKDPDTAFVRWLKDKYNKSPRDLKGDEYVKMSKEFQASKKKDESINEEMKFDDKRDAELKVFAKDLYKKAVKKAKTKAKK